MYEWCQSAGYPHSQWVFNPSSTPLGLHLRRSQPLNITIINLCPVLGHLRLGPWWHPVEQPLFEAPPLAPRDAQESCASLHVVLLDTGKLLTLSGGEWAALPLVHRINFPVTVATLVTTVRSIDPQTLFRTTEGVMLMSTGATGRAIGNVIGHTLPLFPCWGACLRTSITYVALLMLPHCRAIPVLCNHGDQDHMKYDWLASPSSTCLYAREDACVSGERLGNAAVSFPSGPAYGSVSPRVNLPW
jgi:hypothetical protein